jgi:hypothetical protein
MAIVSLDPRKVEPVPAPARLPTDHDRLVARAAGWLRAQGCKTVLTEFHALIDETPDAIGWRGSLSFLVEVKTSRADFLSDRRKRFRQHPETGMGDYRYFLCPPGLLQVDELPPRWGLLYAHAQRVELVQGHRPKHFAPSEPFRFSERNARAAAAMLLSALNRLRLHHGERELQALMHATYASKHP